MKKNKKIFLLGTFIQLVQLLLTYSIPFIIIKSLQIPVSLNLIDVIFISNLIFIAGCFVPIPGATGGMEYVFGMFFAKFISLEIPAIIILWRLITYFIPLFIGGITFNYDVCQKETKKNNNL